MKAEIAVKATAILGEGSLWDLKNHHLYWLDIVGRVLYTYDPVNGRNLGIDLPRMAGAVVPRKAGGLVLALEDGIQLFNTETRTFKKIADPEEDRPETRYNDGKCDPAGRFWIGTMGRNGDAGLGSLYRLDAEGRIERALSGVDISNGIAWSPDKRTMYWTDTLKGEIYAFDYDDAAGTLANQRRAVSVDPDDGLPDGMTIDAEGTLWTACWDGGKVVRFDPAKGTKEDEVRLPVQRVTSCAFGGSDLKHLYITTARMGLSENEIRDQPDAGSLFVCDAGVPGLPANEYAG